MISDPVCTARCRGVSFDESWTLELTLACTLMRKRTLSISEFWTATWRKLRPLLSTWTETDVWGQRRWMLEVSTLPQSALALCYLLGSTGLPLQNSLSCLVILVRHCAGEGSHSLTISNVKTDVWMQNKELNNDIVLVANGGVDRSSALCILTEKKEFSNRRLE